MPLIRIVKFVFIIIPFVFQSAYAAPHDLFKEWKAKALERVSKNGEALKELPVYWRGDRDVVRAAIQQNPLALKHALRFQNDREIVLSAVRINGLARLFASPQLQNDPEIQEISFRNLPEQVCDPELSDLDGRIFSAVNGGFKEMRDTFTPVHLASSIPSIFVRDSRVVLFGGAHLLPYSFKEPLIQQKLMTLLPSHADPLLLKQDKGEWVCSFDHIVAVGFHQCNVEQAMLTALEYHIPFKRGKSCIEGGNCLLFISKGVKKAIIGEFSLYLSLLALEEQGYFLNQTIDEEPSLEAYRMARNEHFFNEQEQIALPCSDLSLREEMDYRKLLVSPLSEEERVFFLEKASFFEAKLKATKALIANELEIPLESIIFVPQTKFHIDMEMTVTPEGVVILNDDSEVVNFLKEVESSQNLSKRERELLVSYKDSAYDRKFTYAHLFEKRKEILQNSGVEFILMPALFEAADFKSCLNYLNGIFVLNKDSLSGNRFTYITTGPTISNENLFHRRFVDLFKRLFPEITFYGVPGMSQFIANYQGGIHCLTFEGRLASESSIF